MTSQAPADADEEATGVQPSGVTPPSSQDPPPPGGAPAARRPLPVVGAAVTRLRALSARAERRLGYRISRSLAPWVVAALAVALCITLSNDFELYVAGTVLIYAMAALGLDWLQGRAGQVSIGTAATMAVGGYLTAVVSSDFSWAVFPIPVILSGILGAGIGLIVGLPALRLRGIYLALATLALQFIIVFGGDRYQQHTEQASGISPNPPSIFGFDFQYGQSYVILLAVLLGITVLILRNVYRHAPGRMWLAIRENELAASAIGVNGPRWKLTAFVGGSAIIACAGSMFAYYTQRVSSETYSLDFAITFIVMIIIGGMGSIAGAILGAILVTIAPNVLTFATDQLPSSPISGWLNDNIFYVNNGLYGLIVLFFLLYQPHGMVPALRRLGRWALSSVAPPPELVALAAAAHSAGPVPAAQPSRPGTQAVLRVENLGVTYQTGARAVDGIDIDVPEGAIVALLGRNGAGKSSTLRAISGFFGSENVRLDGRVTFQGRNITGMSPTRTAGLGAVLVPERDKIFPSLTVRDHLRIAQTRGGPRFEDEALFAGLGARLGSPAGLLSGGERQLLALSSAWLLRPRLMMIDEMSLGLAPVMIRRLVAGVRELRDRHGISFLIVEQNAAAALEIADWVYVVEGGTIAAAGTAEQVARHNLLTPMSVTQ